MGDSVKYAVCDRVYVSFDRSELGDRQVTQLVAWYRAEFVW